MIVLQDAAFPFALLARGDLSHQRGTSSSFKDLTDAVVRPGGAFEILVGLDLLSDFFTLYKVLAGE